MRISSASKNGDLHRETILHVGMAELGLGGDFAYPSGEVAQDETRYSGVLVAHLTASDDVKDHDLVGFDTPTPCRLQCLRILLPRP